MEYTSSGTQSKIQERKRKETLINESRTIMEEVKAHAEYSDKTIKKRENYDRQAEIHEWPTDCS